MPASPPSAAARDELRLLALFHYLIGALAGFVALLPVVYLGMALAADIDPFAANLHLATEGRPPSATLVLAAVLALFLFACAAGVGYAGRCVVAGRRYGFCQAMAFVAMPFLPFGTILGIWSLVVLGRAEVRGEFGLPPLSPVR
ncbi:MAG: hypothetical protein IPJ17_01715 [Holophagales bacterium]|nr:MAG: hypothetical protein IPJ17_01715 [Holophagales bacterium]